MQKHPYVLERNLNELISFLEKNNAFEGIVDPFIKNLVVAQEHALTLEMILDRFEPKQIKTIQNTPEWIKRIVDLAIALELEKKATDFLKK